MYPSEFCRKLNPTQKLISDNNSPVAANSEKRQFFYNWQLVPTYLSLYEKCTSFVKYNIMQILTIINLPWEPENNIITRSETNHKKKTA